jgi:hypothetical protein
MEKTSYEKITGTILLIAGLTVIGYSIQLGINVFIKAQNPPEVFRQTDVSPAPLKNIAENPAKSAPKNLNDINPADMQKMIADNLLSPETIKSIIPQEIFSYIPRVLNLTVFTLFLWVLITAGAKISSLGIALIKTNSNIKV